MSELILIYGAGGLQGAPVARGLLGAGYRVRALVRDSARHTALVDAGVDVVTGDLTDPASVFRATAGAEKVFLMLPFSLAGDPLTAARHAIEAAQDAGVNLLVLNTSGQTPAVPTGLPMLDYRIELERLVRVSGVPNIILRPTAYMENFLGPWVRPHVQTEAVVPYPVETGRAVSWIAAQDVAAFVVAALGRPDLAGRAFDLGGPDPLRGPDIAQAFTEALGRVIRYDALTPEAFGAVLGRVLGPEAEAGIVAAYRAGAAAPPDAMVVDMTPVLATLPLPLTTLTTWVQQHAAAFSADQTVPV
ncbi:SDR family oxidoreductase [uncultured Deinococcus sp.]|uniref:SDR family oxidoreductase n=1 Tax=uncultured Deinococcus sp. TaxID=158789 RepID=UPI0025E57E60|nr:NmrA family NAD(P)-binding protein [uncultured Deinococcus sp.]